MPRSREHPLAFASFRLLRAQKKLLDNQVPVRIGSRALDLLIALVERAGEVVGKNELMTCVWPDTIVEENNLRVHISAIRKLLGDGDRGERFIINVAGRGYSFVAPVMRVDEVPPEARRQDGEVSMLPVSLTRVLGRDGIIGTVVALLETHRLVTLYGPGGIGKTTVSLAVADQLVGENRPSLCFVDLAVVSNQELVIEAIATAVGSPAPLDDPISCLVTYLQSMQLLLIIDNCEHLIGVVAATVERLLHAVPGLKILATSRERLQAEGEHAVLLRPLPCPGPTEPLTAADAPRYPAVELFVERAQGAHEAFTLTDQNVSTIAAICRRLDGIPLAIELVAARANALGLDAMLRSLDRELMAMSLGRRTTGRHQSLNATLEWSFRLLSKTEQVILPRISTFRDLFSARAAMAVVTTPELTADEVANGLMSLVQRSLLVADPSGTHVRYRLLYVTRAFAAARLAQIGEASVFRRRHAEHHCQVMELAVATWETHSRADWRAGLGVELADLRSALEWAFGPDGDASVAARLFVATLPLGAALSQQEFESRALRTLEVLQSQPVPDRVAELRLRTAIAVQQVQAGASEDKWQLELDRMATLALQMGVPRMMTEVLTAHGVMALESANYVIAVQRFEVLEIIAKQADDPIAVLVADRLGAQVFHWAGDQKRARARAERVMRHPSASIPLVYGPGNVDRQVSMRIILARVAWLEGRADEAREIAAAATQRADTPVDILQALGFAACPVALWRGDHEEAEELIARMIELSRRHGFGRWLRLGMCFQQCLDGSTSSGPAAPVSSLQLDMLSTIDLRWANADALARAEAGAAGWCNAELLRVAGERHHRCGGSGARAKADLRYRTALEYARGEGALAWELRVATSLARLLIEEGRRDAAVETLEATCRKFTEGLHTVDYRAAVALMKDQ